MLTQVLIDIQEILTMFFPSVGTIKKNPHNFKHVDSGTPQALFAGSKKNIQALYLQSNVCIYYSENKKKNLNFVAVSSWFFTLWTVNITIIEVISEFILIPYSNITYLTVL